MAKLTIAQKRLLSDAVADLSANEGDSWVRINCPVCIEIKGTRDTRVSLGYQPSTGGFRCFRCGCSGNAKSKGPAPKPVSMAPNKLSENISWANSAFSKLYDTSLYAESEDHQRAYEYMVSRGFGLGELAAADVRICTDGVYDGRVIFPHLDLDGEWWGFTARSYRGTLTQDQPPKVMYPAGMSRARLYNDTELMRRTWEPLLLVEGCIDALHYLPNVCSFLGKPTKDHLSALLATQRPLIVCLDADAEGAAWKLVAQLRLYGKSAAMLPMPPGKDPASVDPAWLRQQMLKVASTLKPTQAQIEDQLDATKYL